MWECDNVSVEGVKVLWLNALIKSSQCIMCQLFSSNDKKEWIAVVHMLVCYVLTFVNKCGGCGLSSPLL